MIAESLVSLKVIINEREYQFTFPNGAPAQDASQALSDIYKKIVDMALENKATTEKTDSQNEAIDCQEVDKEIDDNNDTETEVEFE